MDHTIDAELDKTVFFHDAYNWAALFLSHPQDNFSIDETLKCLEVLNNNTFIKIDFSEEINQMRSFYTNNKFDLLELKKEHSYLFIGPFSLPSPPYESYYLEGGIAMGKRTIQVEQHYKNLGLEISSLFKDAPDHIILEVEFMAMLCDLEASARENDDPEKVTYLQKIEQDFLAKHLLQWISLFREAVEKGSQTDFYPAITRTIEKVAFRHKEELDSRYSSS